MTCDICGKTNAVDEAPDTYNIEFPIDDPILGEDDPLVVIYSICGACLAEKLQLFIDQMDYNDVDALVDAWMEFEPDDE